MKELIKKYAEKYGLEPAIVYGVCMQESSMNRFAARYEDHYRWLYAADDVRPTGCSSDTEEILQKTSFGLMQVMGAVYRELGFKGWLTEVMASPATQLDYGCKHLAKKIKRYGLKEGILSYNSGSPRKNENGEYVNAYYYENVIKHSKNF